jgi:hypothetical protein
MPAAFEKTHRLTQNGESRLKLRQPGSGMYFCVHKYFYQRSEHWKDVREEENKVDMKSKAKDSNLNDVDADVQNIPSARESLAPLDARHLSSLTIVRSRLVKLLEGCTNHLHAAQNIIKTLVRDSLHSGYAAS